MKDKNRTSQKLNSVSVNDKRKDKKRFDRERERDDFQNLVASFELRTQVLCDVSSLRENHQQRVF
jgi:hypothetical protein